MSATAAFWIGLVIGDVIASVTIIFVLALLHVGKRGDEIEPPSLPRPFGGAAPTMLCPPGPRLTLFRGHAPHLTKGDRHDYE